MCVILTWQGRYIILFSHDLSLWKKENLKIFLLQRYNITLHETLNMSIGYSERKGYRLGIESHLNLITSGSLCISSFGSNVVILQKQTFRHSEDKRLYVLTWLVNLSPGNHAQYQEDKKGENANQEADHKERERSFTCKGLVKKMTIISSLINQHRLLSNMVHSSANLATTPFFVLNW